MLLRSPQPYQRIRAGDAARLVDEVNRNHLIAGPGIKLSRTPSGTVVSSTAVGTQKVAAGGGLYPFKVRYHEPAPEEEGGAQPEGQWEVYLPSGSISLRSRCYVMNDPAWQTDGHDGKTDDGKRNLEDGWYVIPLDEAAGEDDETRFNIVAHAKNSVRMQSGEDEYAEESPFVAVTAELIETTEGGGQRNPLEDEDLKTHYAGDVWSTVIATVTVKRTEKDGETAVSRYVRNVLKAAVNVPESAPTYFRPVWDMAWNGRDAATPITVKKLHIEDRTLYVGGVTTTAPDADLTEEGDKYIYVTIDTAGEKPTAELSCVATTDSQPASTKTSQPIRLFMMRDMRILSDTRVYLSNLPYYRGLA